MYLYDIAQSFEFQKSYEAPEQHHIWTISKGKETKLFLFEGYGTDKLLQAPLCLVDFTFVQRPSWDRITYRMGIS